MAKEIPCLSALTLVWVLGTQLGLAQALTGTLIGSVKDEQGGALMGAVVTITSRALIGGPMTLQTNERGQMRFQALPPGSYELAIALQGFAPFREENLRIGAGATIERAVVMKLQGIAETIDVEADGSRIEARGSGFETRFDQDYIRRIPGRRFSMFDFIKAAPGISPTMSSGSVTAFSPSSSVSAFGSNVNENAFLLDGTNFTCPCTGGAIAEPGIDVIEEVQVQSVGASAEFGNVQGAVFNIVTRQGSNIVQYDGSYYGQPAALTGRSVQRPVPNGREESGYLRATYRDFTSHLGGPVVRDRLWFFGGYQYLRDYDSQPGTDSTFPRKYEQDKVLGKLTWQITSRLRLLSSFHNEFWANPERPTVTTPFETTSRFSGSVPTTTFAHLTHTPSTNLLWDARVGRFVLSQLNAPSSGNRMRANRFDRVTGVSSGGPQSLGELHLARMTAKTTLTRYQPGLVAADHEWKVGGQLEKGEHDVFNVIPTGTRFVDNNGEPFQAISRPAATFGGRFITAGAFVSDSMTLADRVTVNAGVRFDHSRAISQDLPARDADGRESGMVKGLGTIYTWNVWSPRLGITAKLSADGRTMIRVSYGRFHQGALTSEMAPIHPGQTPTTTTAFDSVTQGYTRVVSVIDPTINLRLDPQTRSPRTDEYAIGVERDIHPRLSGTIAYVRKHGADFIGWIDTGGIYREESRTLPDGRTVPIFVLSNSTSDRRFLLTNPGDYALAYDGIVIALDKRHSNGWQAATSYTFSRTRGLVPSSGAAAGDVQAGSTFGTRAFGRDPNSITNARGRLANDRPHMLRAAVSAAVPRIGVVLAANLQTLSGKPWAASTQISLPQGDQRVLLETPGTRRLSPQALLDLRLSKAINLGGRGRIELLLDVLNALNKATEEGIATDNFFSPNFGSASVFVEPRRVMLGARVNVGR